MGVANIHIQSGRPMEFTEAEAPPEASRGQSPYLKRIAKSIKALCASTSALLKGRYAQYQAIAPVHLRGPCNVLISQCTDGVFVRYDRSPDGELHLVGGVEPGTLQECVTGFSEYVVQFSDNPESFTPTRFGPEVRVFVSD